MNTLPAERDLPPAARTSGRARAVAAVTEQDRRSRRLVPLAAAAALVAVVAGVVVAGDRWSDGGAPGGSPSTTPRVSASPTRPLPVTPPTEADRQRCGVADSDRYITGYRDADAVTWLFLRAEAKETAVCTTRTADGTTANFMNDWFIDGLGPAPAGRLTATVDVMGALGSDWGVLVGAVPATTRMVVVKGPDGQRPLAVAGSWYVFHFHDPHFNDFGGPTQWRWWVYAYDARGREIASAHFA